MELPTRKLHSPFLLLPASDTLPEDFAWLDGGIFAESGGCHPDDITRLRAGWDNTCSYDEIWAAVQHAFSLKIEGVKHYITQSETGDLLLYPSHMDREEVC